VENGIKESVTVGLGSGELCFQLAAMGHQFIRLINNAMLFCKAGDEYFR
jgi:hypothetical protein